MQQLELCSTEDHLFVVSPDNAIEVWPDIEKYIDSANDFGGGKFLPRNWLSRILTLQADLFVNPTLTAAAIAESQVFPTGKKVYVIVLMGGEGNCDWDAFGHDLELRAKELRCHSIEVYGRKGWKNILESRGMKFAHCVWRKEI